MSKFKINLTMFGNDKDFFTQAFDEAYKITDEPTEPIEEPMSDDVVEDNDKVDDTIETPLESNTEPQNLSKEEIKRMYEEHYGVPKNDEPSVDEETQTALELYRYLEQNPQLIQAMRNVDVEGYSTLNNYVPDEVTRRLQELEEFTQELQYKEYIGGLKSKFNDFNEDDVLKYAEEKDILDLEIAYKALKAESINQVDVESIKKQAYEDAKKQILEELKNNSLNTQSIVGTQSQKPIMNNQINISSREQRIAKAMGMSDEDYAKWR